jgi:hypothetical protein
MKQTRAERNVVQSIARPPRKGKTDTGGSRSMGKKRATRRQRTALKPTPE